MQLELSPEEHRLLTGLLDREFGDLKEEFNKTEARAYKEALKARKRTLVELIEKVSSTAVV